MEKKVKKIKVERVLLEITLLFLVLLLVFFYSLFYIKEVVAEIGEPNATVITELNIGASPPNIISIDIEGGSISLTPNATTLVNCSVEIEDFDTDIDIINVTAEFFHSSSFYGDSNDNNYHYTNNSCFINISYGDVNTALASCLFDIWYYANAGTWNCSVNVTDNSSYTDFDSNTTQIQSLLAVGLPDTINYGTVNATFVSDENVSNVTNFGNVMINLSLSGYAATIGDGWAMNCTYGMVQNISVEYEKYNLTASNPGSLTLSEFEGNYTNLTDSPVTETFNLNFRQNDTDNRATNESYWRIYVPIGVAGSCSGNIVFGASAS